ncbi:MULTISPECIES: hypothetical protein [Providencia]|nr:MULTISPECIES: hypothetical protein [Providencia]MCW4538270.1 hypothetical protein [Providencia rettgeri]MDX4118101.1 hypothetical protein [Providencia rettgeri]
MQCVRAIERSALYVGIKLKSGAPWAMALPLSKLRLYKSWVEAR